MEEPLRRSKPQGNQHEDHSPTGDSLQEEVDCIRLPPVAFNNMLFRVMQEMSEDHVKHMTYLMEGIPSNQGSIKKDQLIEISDAKELIDCLKGHRLLGADNTWFFQYLLYLVRSKEAYSLVLEYTAERMKQSPILCVCEPPEILSGKKVKLRICGDINYFRKIDLEKFRQLLADHCNGELVYIKYSGLMEGSIILYFEVTEACCQALLHAARNYDLWLTENLVLEVSVFDEAEVICVETGVPDHEPQNHQSQADKNFAVLSAILSDDREAVKASLECGGDVNSVCGGKPLLHWAAELDNCDMVDLMVNYGADPNMTSDDGATALHKAAFLGLQKVCKRLLQCERTIAHLTDKLGSTPLHLATDQDILAFVEARKHHAEHDVNTASVDGKANDFGTAKVLLEYGQAAQITVKEKDDKHNESSSNFSGSSEETSGDETSKPQKWKRKRSVKYKLTGLFSKILTIVGTKRPPGSMPCKKPWCKICEYIMTASSVRSIYTGKTFIIQHHITCSTKNVIYLLHCKKCNKQYVGETSKVLRSELAGLLATKEDKDESPMMKHFCQDDHNLWDLEIAGIEAMEFESDKERIARTNNWIIELNSMEPHGLNEAFRTSVAPRYTYDVFLCHSSQDFAAAFDILNKLEQQGLQCLIEDRDFLPGRNLLDEILRAVESSRKAILVLSPNFIADEMCRFAVMATMAEVKKRSSGDSFLVLLRIQECPIPPELKLSRCLDCIKSTEGLSAADTQELVGIIQK